MTDVRLFIDKSKQPNDAMLSASLGSSYGIWKEILTSVVEEFGPVVGEWKYYGTKIGWTMKLLVKKRNLFFFSPYNGYFILSFVFGDKSVKEVEKSALSERIKSDLRNARKYAEGRGLRLEVKKRSQIHTILKLVAIKMNK